jgi:enoyl-CoA hydratase/carnithine racemase
MATYQAVAISRPAEFVALVEMGTAGELNLWSQQLESEVFGALDTLAADSSVRAIGLLSRGRAFCAGADLGGLRNRVGERPEESGRPAQITPADILERRVLRAVSIPKPVVAAVNGHCVGIGLALAVSCDFRIAAADARLQSGFPKRGLIAEHGTSWLLPRIVGLGVALEILMTSRPVRADEALAMGLVHEVAEPDGLRQALIDFTMRLTRTVSPRSLAVIKRQVYRDLEISLDDAVRLASGDMINSFGAPDAKEGVRSFLERRDPDFPPPSPAIASELM